MPHIYIYIYIEKQIIGLLTVLFGKLYNQFWGVSYVINYHLSQNFVAAMLNRLNLNLIRISISLTLDHSMMVKYDKNRTNIFPFTTVYLYQRGTSSSTWSDLEYI